MEFLLSFFCSFLASIPKKLLLEVPHREVEGQQCSFANASFPPLPPGEMLKFLPSFLSG